MSVADRREALSPLPPAPKPTRRAHWLRARARARQKSIGVAIAVAALRLIILITANLIGVLQKA